MKRIGLFIIAMFLSVAARAQTEMISWYIDNQTYTTTTCEYGGDIDLPTTPYKKGYTFQGWAANYIPIEYLESTGTQWIDTGIIVNSDYSVEIEGIFGCGHAVCGQYGTDFNQAFMLGFACGSGMCNWGGSSSSCLYGEIGLSREKTLIKIDKNGIYNNNVKKVSFIPPSPEVSSASGHFLLFSTLGQYGGSSSVVYRFSMYDDNNTLVRDMIPVLDKDGTPCMYDLVERKFYYNKGTGDFIAGPVLTQ